MSIFFSDIFSDGSFKVLIAAFEMNIDGTFYESWYKITKWCCKVIDTPQHDEVEPNLKKSLHTNGIWGLEANSM